MAAGSVLDRVRNEDLARVEEERSLLAEIVKREHAHLEAIVDNLPGLVWESWGMPDASDLRVDYLNDYIESVLGYSREDWFDRPHFWLEIIDANDRARVLREQKAICLSGKRGTQQFRWVAKDGMVRWMESHITPVRSLSGDPVGMCGITLDITERKNAEIALQTSLKLLRKSEKGRKQMFTQTRNLAGRLTKAQEEERRRISRDLHDNVGQKLAMMGMVISKAKAHSAGNADLDRHMLLLREHLTELSEDISHLARELHPVVLEHLDLEDALRSFCMEFSRFHDIAVTIEVRELGAVDAETRLCIYRIVQEALHNVAKHANSPTARVLLTGRPQDLVLRVSDSGIGFDPAGIASKEGLGLLGMKERVLLLNGALHVSTRPGGGTAVRVKLPRRKGEQ